MNRGDTLRGVFVRHRWRLLLAVALLLLTMLAGIGLLGLAGGFLTAAALAGASSDPLQLLRERVTSKGGTTYAALTSLEASGVKDAFVRAMQAAQQRAEELGDEFGKA